MALSRAELEAVRQAAINVPPNVRSEVHFTFTADFIVALFQGLIDLSEAKDVAEAKVAELTAVKVAPVVEEPIEEELKP